MVTWGSSIFIHFLETPIYQKVRCDQRPMMFITWDEMIPFDRKESSVLFGRPLELGKPALEIHGNPPFSAGNARAVCSCLQTQSQPSEKGHVCNQASMGI